VSVQDLLKSKQAVPDTNITGLDRRPHGHAAAPEYPVYQSGDPMTDKFNPSSQDFAELFENSAAASAMQEGQVIPATVVRIENDVIVVDVGLKTEGRIAIKEFALEDKQPAPGDIVDVYLDRIENALGDAVLSRDKARREERWIKLEKSFNNNERLSARQPGRYSPGAGCRPAYGSGAALRHAEARPGPRQCRCLSPGHPRREPRRATG
jgi:hypothetical protein